ncbi:acyltransferase [Fusobacterium sp. MFO224]|uniref:acyltransferase n=1 Tax=Fusobacterium sp. MFO224 TaxID=3378070 RepID=UPI00385563DA
MKYKIQWKYLLKRSFVKIKGKSQIKNEGIIKSSKIKISGNDNELILKKGARINKSNIWINGKNNKVILGEDCDLNNLTIIMDNNNGLIEIGEATGCVKIQIVSLEPYDIKIGKDCMLSYDIEIRNTDSHKIFNKKDNKRINFGKEVLIGDNVWIAARTMVLKGSKIGKGSIIGASSIVSGEIEPNSIAVGSPAKIIKKDIYWNRESVIEE